MVDVFEGLNESQKEAVSGTGNHLLVVAGPGTGKTLTIVRRIANLIGQGARPEEILAVTFTNRAAREMRERVQALLGEQAARIFLGTFHLLGLRMLRDNGHRFSVCSREQQVDILKAVTGGSAKAAQQLAERISKIKNLVEKPVSDIMPVLDGYQKMLLQKEMLDFDDLISIPVSMLREGRLTPYGNRFKQVIVDEYQDISPTQYELVSCLVDCGACICAVGDSDQAIYAFRGADIRNFLNFRNDFADAAQVTLKENYRSTGIIVEASSRVIENNRERIAKELNANREPGKLITVMSVPNERAEAEAIVREIEVRMGGTSHYRLSGIRTSTDFSGTTYSFSDFAVLFRTHAQARAIEDAFVSWGIPCQVAGSKNGVREKAIIEHLSSYARMPVLPDSLDLLTFLRKTGKKANLSDAESELVENLALAYADLPFRDAVLRIIDELTLFTSADTFDPRADAVALMTLHMAKGLEFRTVFITGVEEGVMPLSFNGYESDTEEERRLFYVGMTRAKEELFLLHSAKRLLFGKRLKGAPSPFLSEIPQDLVQKRAIGGGRETKHKQMGLFQ